MSIGSLTIVLIASTILAVSKRSLIAFSVAVGTATIITIFSATGLPL